MPWVSVRLRTPEDVVHWLRCGFELNECYDTTADACNTEGLRELLVQAIVQGKLPATLCTAHTRCMAEDALDELEALCDTPEGVEGSDASDADADASALPSASLAFREQLAETLTPLRAWIDASKAVPEPLAAELRAACGTAAPAAEAPARGTPTAP